MGSHRFVSGIARRLRQGKAFHGGRRVRGPILITFALLLVFVIGLFLGAAWLMQTRYQQRAMAEGDEAFRRLLELLLDHETDALHGTVDALIHDAQVRGAFLGGRRDDLYHLVFPLYEDLHNERRITDLTFVSPDRTAFLRVHDHDDYGNRENSALVDRALKTGRVASGLEIDRLGLIELRIVRPWRNGGKMAGAVVMGEDIGPLIARIHRVLDLGVVAAVKKSMLDRAEWQEGLALVGRRADWNAFPSLVTAVSTLPALPRPLAALLAAPKPPPPGRPVTIRDGGRILDVAFLPLVAAGGSTVGTLAVVRDITDSHDAFDRAMLRIGAVSAFAGLAVFLVFLVILTRVEREILHQHELETRFARLSADHHRIVQVEKLSEVGRTIGEISHQINNPLVGVINLAQLAEREADDPARVRTLLAQIRKAGEDCHAFVHRMTKFTGIARLERKPSNLGVLIGETVALFLQSRRREAPIDTAFPDRSVMLDVDPTLFRHAVFNLLVNAVEAGPPDAPVTIRLAREEADGAGWWRVTVEDRGPGVPEALRERIFEPFFTTRHDGTGLGLPVVQHIAMLHGGRVTAADRPGGGAVFALWLPENGNGGRETLA